MSFRPPTETRPGANPARGALVDALQKHVLDAVTPVLDSALADVDDYLFDRSQNGEVELGLGALRDLRCARAQIVRDVRAALTDRFSHLQDAAAPSEAGSEPGLSLLSTQDLEQQLAVEQLAGSVLRGVTPAFELVGKRMAALAGKAALRRRDDPLDPICMAAALGSAMAEQDLGDELRIIVFKYFERELAPALEKLYERCNALLVSAGVLPELRATGAQATPRRPPAAQGHQEAAGSADPAPEYGGAQASPQMGMPQMGMPHMGMPQMGMPQMGAPQPTMPMQVSMADQALFVSMLGQLQGWRNAMGIAPPPASAAGPSTPALSTADLLSILSLMQHDAAPIIPRAGEGQGPGALAGALRKQMEQSARKLGVAAGDNLTLDGLDGDAVDLVALLFDVLLDGPQYDTRIRQKIGRMLVPFVKVAVQDRRMFLMKDHPARKLLNTVAEACEGNRGEEPQEREILNHVDHTIDRLVAEFNEDVAIFETLEQELRSYMAQHRKRFDLAERRTTEAQWGRERLEHAREAALQDLDAHRAGRELPPIIGDFLSRHTAHHLVQVVLRDGQDSVRYDRALGAVDGLLAALDRASEGQWPDPAWPLPEAGLQEILSSAGFTDEAAREALEALHETLARVSTGQAVPENDPRIATQAIPQEPVTAPAKPQLEVVADNAHLNYEDTVLERVRALKVGDWVQLATADQHFAPAKVSWISPISSRLLLVNRRGIRVLVASAQELAAMVALDKLRLREGETAFDDAMHQMVNRLESVNGER